MMKQIFFLAAMVLSISCSEITHKQQESETYESVNITDSVTNNCENTLEWLKENAVSINPDSFPDLHQLSRMQNSIYKEIDKSHFDCLFGKDSALVTNFTFRYNDQQEKIFNYPIYYVPFTKLCDVYLDSKQHLKAFTFFSIDGGGHTWLYYVSLNAKNGQIGGVAEIAYSWGDMGFIWDESSIWINQNTIQKNIVEYCFDTIVKQAKVKIKIEEEGEIIFSEPQITVDLSHEEIGLIHEQKSKEFWGMKE